MLANYLIGLREGLEASLIISILIAFLVKSGRRDRLAPVGYGVLVALVISIAFGALLTYTSSSILQTTASRENFGGVFSIVAVGFVTWMIFWMRRTSRSLSGELKGKMGDAVEIGIFAVALTAFAAVAREGLETALFFWSAVQAAGTTTSPVAGFSLGLATSVVLAWLLYRRSITLNLSAFFTWTGAALVLVAGGVLAYGVHDLQEGGILPGLNNLAFDVSSTIPPSSWYGTLLKGTLNFSPQTTVAQAIAWLLYVIPVMTLFLMKDRTPAKPKGAADELPKSTASGATKTGVAVSGAVAVSLLVAGCGGESAASKDPNSIKVTASDTACVTSKAELPAGAHTFVVKNDGDKITEMYVYAQGDRAVGEVENIGPATSRNITVTLKSGDYQIACKPGMTGTGIRTPLKVTGTDSDAKPMTPELAKAVAGYRTYVENETNALIKDTVPFVAAIKAGNIAEAKGLYPAARIHYERIEPIAESFGDLDPKIDARINDVEPGATFTGFHRLEQALWEQKDVSKMGPIADQLLVDEKALLKQVEQVELTPDQLGNGARELLDEVAKSKVTGEEERYSRIDLVDFQGNLEGAEAAYEQLQPTVEQRDPELAKTLDARFKALDAELAKYGSGTKFVSYDDLTKAQVRALAARVDAVSEPLSKVTAVVVKPQSQS
jgi:high-affinity iron transporter